MKIVISDEEFRGTNWRHVLMRDLLQRLDHFMGPMGLERDAAKQQTIFEFSLEMAPAEQIAEIAH